MNSILTFVNNTFGYISKRLNLTYNKVNIITYYGFMPLAYSILLDSIFGVHFIVPIFIIAALFFAVPFNKFSERSDKLFNLSVKFLEQFGKLGISYIQASVVICVIVPLLF